MTELDFSKIEKKWQKAWEQKKIFQAKENSKKEKYYILEMFPYPSGSGLHMGHAWNYTIGDIIARMKLMQGYQVLHPMGFDALGLPAENAAIKEKVDPEAYTHEAIKNYIRQLEEIGLSYDWERLLNTSRPEYYRWDQWIFINMLKKGLAYQKESAVNWCPTCNTVLANEQVQNGVCWRHEDTKVEVKHLKQWFLKITDYANELYESIDTLTEWPEKTKAMQKNWIGKSEGIDINFEVNGEVWPVFTTRPDTIYGVTFLVISAQHQKLAGLIKPEQQEAVNNFIKKLGGVSAKNLAEEEWMNKEGVFTGSYATNPINGSKVPIYAGNFVVADYGSGMVMAVPAHDKRDYAFAKKYGIDIRTVIDEEHQKKREAYTGTGILINSGPFNGLPNEQAKKKISEYLEQQKLGKKTINYKLRDWSISRQRYWGTPIPIIHCETCGAVPVPEKDLPVRLPKIVTFGKGNPLETNMDWLKTECPTCGKEARREAETMDTFVNSSWYFYRYCDPKNNKAIFDTKKVKKWCPINTYIGGAEHACMHLIYCRFYTKFLRDLGLLNFGEPIQRLFHQGILHGQGGERMSKSKGNIVLPETVSKHYGMDTARFFMCSLASPDKNIDWSDTGIIGSLKFVKRLFIHQGNFYDKQDSPKLASLLNKTIQNVTTYYDTFDYRKATIELRALFDLIEQEGSSKETYENFLKMLAPICPHISEELWSKLKHTNLISTSEWPKADKKKILPEQHMIDISEKIITEIRDVLNKTNIITSNIHVYVMPFELEQLNEGLITNNFDKTITFYSVSDKEKYDPKNLARKARPGKPSVYLE